MPSKLSFPEDDTKREQFALRSIGPVRSDHDDAAAREENIQTHRSRALRLIGSTHSEVMMSYALFDCDRKVSETLPTVREVWLQALEAGLISDIPVADEDGDQVLPVGYHVKEVADLKGRESTPSSFGPP